MNGAQAEQISQALRKVTRLYNSAIVEMVKDLELTKPQLITLGQIYRGPKTIGQISEGTFLSYSTVSGIIDRLERDGWVERVRDTSDRRVTWIRTTVKSEQFKSLFHSYEQKLFGDVLRELSDDQVNGVLQSLQLLMEQFQAHLDHTASQGSGTNSIKSSSRESQTDEASISPDASKSREA
ncbi:MarR family winged helix-turn-helix transcriptional regulator [Paenibacillus turpanensis]|uniref:MarR family winged helix-turn-helix transcriptional regulator n=1 Tax=Paenibacillus turpanensis TaxID=2689078 RepID=UPI001408E97A|nr:MarR family transcriptional regulator [Paenibacillus turpanensis]